MSKTPRATHAGEIVLGDLVIPCAVLEDGTRILSERGVTKALGGKRGGSHWVRKRAAEAGAELPVYISAKNLTPFIGNELASALNAPIVYIPADGGGAANGVRAEVLPQICTVWLEARDAGALRKSQAHIAAQADIIMRGLAHVGIIALIDEATGYQYDRAADALAEILAQFISKELCKWVKTFPDEFYAELFRLRGWRYDQFSTKRPVLAGRLTNDIVYTRLAPGVLESLRDKNPVMPAGWRRHRHHQWLTSDFGHPRLREHLAAVIALMKAASTWTDFRRSLERALPKYLPMPLFAQAEKNA